MYLTIELDKNIYYDAPAPSSSSIELTDFLEYFNNPNNKKKYLIGVLAVAVMCVLHGYRTTMFAMIVGLSFLLIFVFLY